MSKPVKNLQRLKAALGEGYEIRQIDGEDVLYRDLGDGLDIEISCAAVPWKRVNIYLWKDKSHILSVAERVKQDCIAEAIEGLIAEALQ